MFRVKNSERKNRDGEFVILVRLLRVADGQRGWQACRGGSATDLVVMPGRLGKGLRGTQEKHKLEKTVTTRAAAARPIRKDLHLHQNRCDKLKCRSTKAALLYNCDTYTSPRPC